MTVSRLQSPLLRSLQPEDQVLLICTRRSLRDADREALTALAHRQPLRWDLIYAAADRHGVAPLVFANLTACKEVSASIPGDIVSRLRLRFVTNLAFKQQLGQSLARFLEYLASRSIEGMLVKSLALDTLVYGARPYTTCRDADVVLRPRLEALAAEDVRALGHLAHRRAVEFDYFEHHDLTLNGVLPVDFATIWRDAVRSEFQGQPVFVMCPEDLLIAACVNACRKRFFLLKALCDITAVVEAYPALDWGGVQQKAARYGCDRVLYAALRVTQLLVGCALPAGFLNQLGLRPWRAALIDGLATRLAPVSITAAPGRTLLLQRQATLSLLLPYVIYRPGQVARKLQFLWRTRSATVPRGW